MYRRFLPMFVGIFLLHVEPVRGLLKHVNWSVSRPWLFSVAFFIAFFIAVLGSPSCCSSLLLHWDSSV